MRNYYVYIMMSRSGVLYIGVTNDLRRRVHQHKHATSTSFTGKYRCDALVYYEWTDDVVTAITREKQLKGLLRSKKMGLIRAFNPGWADLAGNIQ